MGKQIGIESNGRSLQEAASEIEASIMLIIKEAEIEEGDVRGCIAMKLMRARSAQPDDFTIVDVSADPDALNDIIFQIIIAGKTDIIRLDTARIIELATQAPN